jgi:integrase
MRLSIKAIDALKPNGRDVVYWDEDVPRYGLRVKPSGVKSFIIQYRTAQGRSRKLTIGQYGTWAPEEARNKAKQLLRLVDQGTDPAEIAEKERKAITVSQLCDEYMSAACAGIIATRSGRPKKASTLHQDESRISAHIKPLLGDKLVKDLTQAQVRRFFEDVVKGKTAKTEPTGKKRGKSVVKGGTTAAKRSVGLLGGMLTYAVHVGHRDEVPNPAHKIGMPGDKRRVFRLSAEGWRAYGIALQEGEIKGIAWQLIGIAKLLALTGARYNEIVSLKWTEADTELRCFRFDFDRVKSGPFRPLGNEAVAVLRNLRAQADSLGRASPYVFPAAIADKDQPYSARKAWSRLGLGFNPHCLRHAFCSAAEDDLGFHESTVGAIVGHKKRTSGGNTTRLYIHKADNTLQAAADSIGEYIIRAMSHSREMLEVAEASMKPQVFHG